jgi:ParB-like chromosome segregation protein Spo0J
MNEMKICFQMRRITVPLQDILPVRHLKDPENTVSRYKAIRVSLKEVGLIEPLMIYPQKGMPGKYLLLDGHLRLFALKQLGQAQAECLIANDDECFTYNARVSRVTPIQEHRMIQKAVEMGVKPDRIAAALNIPVRVVKAYLNLLVGIHPEVADLLKDKNVVPRGLRMLRQVNGVRQVEIAELMVSTGNYSAAYAEALVLGTPKDQFIHPEKPKKNRGLPAEHVARMEEEMVTLERDLKTIETGYGQNMLNLTVAHSYIRKLLNNVNVARFLSKHYPDIHGEFAGFAATESL